MNNIYVILDVYSPKDQHYKRSLLEEKVTKGPYTKLFRGYGGEIHGLTPNGEEEKVFEVTASRGGCCDTCAYEYPDFGVEWPEPYYSIKVKHFEIEIREE